MFIARISGYLHVPSSFGSLFFGISHRLIALRMSNACELEPGVTVEHCSVVVDMHACVF